MPSSSIRTGWCKPRCSKIARGFRMTVELELIKGGRLLQQPGDRREFLFEVGHCLAKRQIQEELDKADEVAARPQPWQ